jgi:hypothetical protein
MWMQSFGSEGGGLPCCPFRGRLVLENKVCPDEHTIRAPEGVGPSRPTIHRWRWLVFRGERAVGIGVIVLVGFRRRI